VPSAYLDSLTHSPSVNCAPSLCPQALIGAEQGTFDLNAIDNRKRGFGSAGPQRPNPSCVARGPFSDIASIRCYVMIGGRKVRVARRLADPLIALLLMFLDHPPPCPQFFFNIIMSAHPRSGTCEHVKELTLLALLGIPSIPGVFEFKRPPRAPADVHLYMHRSPPYQRRPRRFGIEITGKITDVKACAHAAAMSKAARELLAAVPTAGE